MKPKKYSRYGVSLLHFYRVVCTHKTVLITEMKFRHYSTLYDRAHVKHDVNTCVREIEEEEVHLISRDGMWNARYAIQYFGRALLETR